MTDLVEFPLAGPVYEDTGEGGMHVMLLVPGANPPVDAFRLNAGIRLHFPEECLNRQAAQALWPSEDNRRQGLSRSLKAYKVLRDGGHEELAQWAVAADGPENFSYLMQAAVHMGRISERLRSTSSGDYWQATTDDLAPLGLLLYDILDTACSPRGISPVLLTFLES